MHSTITTPENAALAQAIAAVRQIMDAANAETFGRNHAYQVSGCIYGDAYTLLRTLLAALHGEEVAERVYDVMLDSGESHAYAAQYVAEEIASSAGLDDIDLDGEVVDADADAPATSVEQPGEPLWNCCVANPARVISYDDGGATVACESCSYTVPSRRRHDLPAGWLAAHKATGATVVEPKMPAAAVTPTNASAVSRALHAGGMRPVPAERRWKWNGVNVSGKRDYVRVAGVSGLERYDEEFSREAEAILREAGYVIERSDATTFVVLGRAA